MIGGAGEDGGGAVELLGRHDAGEHVRPDHRAEGEREVGAGADRLAVPVGAAEGEGAVAAAVVATIYFALVFAIYWVLIVLYFRVLFLIAGSI